MKIEKQPDQITPVLVDAVLMPNGEIIALGKTIGRFGEMQDFVLDKQQVVGTLYHIAHNIREYESDTFNADAEGVTTDEALQMAEWYLSKCAEQLVENQKTELIADGVALHELLCEIRGEEYVRPVSE